MSESTTPTDEPPDAPPSSEADNHRPGPGLGGQTSDRVMITIEDLIYVAVAGVLTLLAAIVLGGGVVDFVDLAVEGDLREGALDLLDSVLLVLMLVELLHTVGISIRENVLVPEPFLIVGLIAAVRRILILTAEQAAPTAEHATGFRLAMLELGLLTLLIAGLIGGIVVLSRWRDSDAFR